MKIDILTLFPKMFENILGESILKRAQVKGLVDITLHNLRDWTFDSHRSADDKPFGGGPGMVMKVEPVYLALRELRVSSLVARRSSLVKNKSFYKTRVTNDERRNTKYERRNTNDDSRVILLTPQGKCMDQKTVRRLSKYKRLVLICGHYEGVDERIRYFVDEEVSVGDYVLTCGELPALVLIDAVVRLIPGVLGHGDSAKDESFENGLLEYPQYTRPADFDGMKVPDVLLSGDHKRIEAWRRREALRRTKKRRPDLLKRNS